MLHRRYIILDIFNFNIFYVCKLHIYMTGGITHQPSLCVICLVIVVVVFVVIYLCICIYIFVSWYLIVYIMCSHNVYGLSSYTYICNILYDCVMCS